MKLTCPTCKQHLECENSMAGMRVECPACQGALDIPALDAQASLRSSVQAAVDQGRAAERTVSALLRERGLEGGVDLGAAEPKDSVKGDTWELVPNLTPDEGRRYEIGELVAQGGMGAILAAREVNLRRTVAMKVMLRPKEAESHEVLRFVEEAQVTGQLQHPGIVPVHELGVGSYGQVYYTMGFVKGQTLKAILKGIAEGDKAMIERYPLARLLTVFQKICDAVGFAHSKRVIHRDLKPENVMVGEHGEVLVMDWGLAKVLPRKQEKKMRLRRKGAAPVAPLAHPESAYLVESVRQDEGHDDLKTMSGMVMGTPGYMAPEQAEGRIEEVDERADIYSLGAILYDILVLRAPIKEHDLQVWMKKVTSGEIAPPTEYNTKSGRKKGSGFGVQDRERADYPHLPAGHVPESLSAVAMKALALKPVARYGSVTELQREIEAYQTGFATSAEGASAWRLIRLFVQRHKAASIAAALGLATLVTACMALALVRSEQAKSMLAEKRTTEARLEKMEADERTAELEKQRAEEWIPVVDTDFKDDKLPDGFDAVYCENPDPESRQYLPAGKRISVTNGVLSIDTRKERPSNVLTMLRWRYPIGDDVRLEAIVDEMGAPCLAVGGDAAVGYRAIVYYNYPRSAWLDMGGIRTLRFLSQGIHALPPPKARHVLRVEKQGQTVRLWVDGQLMVDYYDPVPLSGEEHRTFSINAWGNAITVHHLAAWRRRSPEVVSVLDVGRSHLRHRHYDEAEAFFRAEAETREGTQLGLEAQYLRGLALQGLGRSEEAAVQFQQIAAQTGQDAKGHRLMAMSLAQMARLCVEKQEFDRCVELARKVRTLDPGNPVAGDLVGLITTRLRTNATVTLANTKLMSGTSRLSVTEQTLCLRTLTELRGDQTDWALDACGLTTLAGLERAKCTSLDVSGNQISDVTPLRGLPLKRLILLQNCVTNLAGLEGMPLTSLDCSYNCIEDLSPLNGVPLTWLGCAGNRIRDLGPLRGMPLSSLDCSDNRIAELAPLKGMPLTELYCSGNRIVDLTPLRGMALTGLSCEENRIANLAPLNGMPLKAVDFPIENITNGIEVLREMNTLTKINALSPADFWRKYDAGEFKQK